MRRRPPPASVPFDFSARVRLWLLRLLVRGGALEAFAREGAKARYPGGVPERVREALAHELALIAQLKA